MSYSTTTFKFFCDNTNTPHSTNHPGDYAEAAVNLTKEQKYSKICSRNIAIQWHARDAAGGPSPSRYKWPWEANGSVGPALRGRSPQALPETREGNYIDGLLIRVVIVKSGIVAVGGWGEGALLYCIINFRCDDEAENATFWFMPRAHCLNFPRGCMLPTLGKHVK